MWGSRRDFQGRWEEEEDLGLIFLGFPRPGISTALGELRISVHAVLRSPAFCFWWKPRNNLRLACCIARAASVSLRAWAIRSKPSMLASGLRKLWPRGKACSNLRRVSHGVA